MRGTSFVKIWIDDKAPPPHPSESQAPSSGEAGKPPPVPPVLPAQTPMGPLPRYAESSICPYLGTNANFLPTRFSEDPISGYKTELSISLHGSDTPCCHYCVMQRFAQGLVNRTGYRDFAGYGTAVGRAEKIGDERKVTLRKGGEQSDYCFEELESDLLGSVIHSNQYRGRDAFKDKMRHHKHLASRATQDSY
ncbi:hypothetical protein DL765_001087 [Monosporascus sp. GIB2]|nr:hypothetical protein DL765_001087 [Monosporascus sp. GIB2]